MKIMEVGAFEAKTHLSDLLEKVQRGVVFYITKRGKRVAILKPCETEKVHSISPKQILNRFRALRAATKPGSEKVKDLIEMGRRF